MTYFRMRMDIRKILEIEISQDHETYQHKVTTILAEHFAPKLKLFKSCATLGNRYNIEPRELYLAAISAKNSNELSGILPQITHNLSVKEAFDKLLLHDNPVAWVDIGSDGLPNCIYLTEPDVRNNSIELPVKPGSKEQEGN